MQFSGALFITNINRSFEKTTDVSIYSSLAMLISIKSNIPLIRYCLDRF